ncbi:NUDIX domain-containing protein [Brevibacillus sp. SYP-B805]|uniref:NUDIX domain-containing protein n=1 Tax=Brevibacillus sp. SYP-B805 TaxID=1578199 RepID=UPI0013EBFDE2|nr:NUDIX domain-containing protein [Brevibacillus sp. SYP-B805]NGQ93746.1 NUDIX domain-containing protein [Brevibacillus sp. SYP-B805]
MEAYQDIFGNPIQLTFDPQEFQPPGHVLVVPLWGGKIVFTHHKERGIELPGGKIERGETPLAAAVRELFEETGASLARIELIGQYIITIGETKIVKAIYLAEVNELWPLPGETDTRGAVVFEEIPHCVADDPRFSPFMKDEVYPRTLQYLGLR